MIMTSVYTYLINAENCSLFIAHTNLNSLYLINDQEMERAPHIFRISIFEIG